MSGIYRRTLGEMRDAQKRLAEYRKEEWLRKNIDVEINYARTQRRMWLENLELAKAKNDQTSIFKIKRDLEFNAKKIIELMKKKFEFLTTPQDKLINTENEGR